MAVGLAVETGACCAGLCAFHGSRMGEDARLKGDSQLYNGAGPASFSDGAGGGGYGGGGVESTATKGLVAVSAIPEGRSAAAGAVTPAVAGAVAPAVAPAVAGAAAGEAAGEAAPAPQVRPHLRPPPLVYPPPLVV